MKLRLRKLNEETRTVSGFTEFTHNGKDSLMETDDTPSGAASFFKGKYSTEFFATNKSINDVYEYTKTKSSIVYNSLTNFYNEHKQLLTTDKSKSLKTILVTITNENKERTLLAVAAYLLKKDDNSISHILVSDVNFDEQKSKEIYGYIVDVIAEKKLSKIEEIVVLGEKKLEQKGFFVNYKKLTESSITASLYIYKNPFYKEATNNAKNGDGFDRGDKVDNNKKGATTSHLTADDISKDNSKLTDKKDKVNNSDSILKAAVKGYQQGVSSATNNQNVFKSMYTAYDNQRKGAERYMY